MIGFAAFAVVAMVATVHGLRAITRRDAMTVLVSLVCTAVYVLALFVPALLQASGLVESKLVRAGFAYAPTTDEVGTLALRWAVELAVIVLAEALVWRTRAGAAARLRQLGPAEDVDGTWRRVALLMVLVGLAANVAFPAAGVEDRGAGGDGIGVLLRTFLIVGLAVVVYFRLYRERLHAVLLVGGVAFMVLSNVRSPLLVLACAALASALRRGRISSARSVAVVVVVGIVFALTASLMSNLRANTARDYGFTTGEVVGQTLENPWVAPYGAGLDTLDGYRFSVRVAELEPPRPSEFLNVVLTFVPRAVWPDKPSSLAVDLSRRYLAYGASGQFLSPVGYLLLLTGSYPLALLALALLTGFAALLVRVGMERFWLTIVVTVVVRFMIGGSSFDLYYGLTLAVPVAAASWYVRRVEQRTGRSSRLDRLRGAPLGSR